MGEAKRRKQSDRNYGISRPYTLHLQTKDELLFEIPYTIQWLPTGAARDKRSIAVAIQIVGLLIDDCQINQDYVALALGERSTAQLLELRQELPEHWYATISNPDGQTINVPGKDKPVMLGTSREGIPADEDEELGQYQPFEVLERAIV